MAEKLEELSVKDKASEEKKEEDKKETEKTEDEKKEVKAEENWLSCQTEDTAPHCDSSL